MSTRKKINALLLVLALFGLYFSSSSYAADFTLDGPTSGVINVESEPFVITTGGGFSGNIRVTIDGGGLNTTKAFNFKRDDLSQSFTITPTALDHRLPIERKAEA